MFTSDNKILCALLLGALFLAGCSEEVEVHTRNMDRTFLVVEGMLTDNPAVPQRIMLTESVDGFHGPLGGSRRDGHGQRRHQGVSLHRNA